MGLRHFESLDIPAEVLPLKTKRHTEDPSFAARLESASIAYFSGGNPAYLAGALSGSRFWSELLRAMDRGLAYVGCSAGVSCLGDVAPDSAIRDFTSTDLWKPGLRLFPKLFLGPHWDALNAYVAGLQELFVGAVPPGHRLLAIDERTAVVGDGTQWQVMGKGGASLLDEGTWQTFRPGESFEATFHATKEPSTPA
jgi:cyanophycinase-like exopeptidase